ncbi:MAG: STAS domain-containing protein [Gemmataceae bacterium]
MNELFHTEQRGDVFILHVLQDLRELKFETVNQALQSFSEKDSVRALVIDFAGTRYFGSSAMGHLTQVMRKIQGRGGSVAFCNLSPLQKEILEITGFDTIWPCFETLDKALEAVSAHA